ncbi:MAG: hypothetical protein M1836_005427 [Candelina mexicana]|nr:MAG: hypothetical protein M1836_005427 [Candelina mexicana]
MSEETYLFGVSANSDGLYVTLMALIDPTSAPRHGERLGGRRHGVRLGGGGFGERGLGGEERHGPRLDRWRPDASETGGAPAGGISGCGMSSLGGPGGGMAAGDLDGGIGAQGPTNFQPLIILEVGPGVRFVGAAMLLMPPLTPASLLPSQMRKGP